MLKNNKGFTLMEILVVVTIIGILAAIAVPSYIYAVEQGRKDACAANVQILNTQVERYRLATGNMITSGTDQTLVEFLTELGYLVHDMACPLGGAYLLQEKTAGNPVQTFQTVKCNHDD